MKVAPSAGPEHCCSRASCSPKRNLCPPGQLPTIQRSMAGRKRWFAGFSSYPCTVLYLAGPALFLRCHSTGAHSETALLALSDTDLLRLFRLRDLSLALRLPAQKAHISKSYHSHSVHCDCSAQRGSKPPR